MSAVEDIEVWERFRNEKVSSPPSSLMSTKLAYKIRQQTVRPWMDIHELRRKVERYVCDPSFSLPS